MTAAMEPRDFDGADPNRRAFLRTAAAAGAVSALPVVQGIDHAGSEYASDFEIRPFSVSSQDAVDLNGHVYLPEDADPPYGTVLYWSPYWNTPVATPSDDPPSDDSGDETETLHDFGGLHRLIREGFAIAAVNMRGTGISEGCFQWGSPVDVRDGYVLVEGLADQEWSNGKIGMYGLSYTAYSQLLAMAGDPPSLEAVLPVEGVVDLWSFYMQNGAALSGGVAYPIGWDALVGLSAAHNDPERADCPERIGFGTASADIATTGDKTAWFRERDLLDRVADSRVPMFYVHGHLAGVPTNGHTLQIEGLYESRRPQTTRMALGHWGHNFDVGEGFIDDVVHWFDHHLRNGPNRVKTGVVEYQDDTGSWYETRRWPPRSDRTELYLSGTSLVGDESDVQPSERRFQAEPSDTGMAAEDCGHGQLRYVSGPIAETVRLAGNAVVSTTLSSTHPGGNYVAKLFHTPGAGGCPDPEATEFTRLFADLRHWQTPGQSRPFPVAEPTPVTFETQSFATEIPAGNRIVLVVSGGDSTIQPRESHPNVAVSTGSDRAGSIDLPVVDGTLEI